MAHGADRPCRVDPRARSPAAWPRNAEPSVPRTLGQLGEEDGRKPAHVPRFRDEALQENGCACVSAGRCRALRTGRQYPRWLVRPPRCNAALQRGTPRGPRDARGRGQPRAGVERPGHAAGCNAALPRPWALTDCNAALQRTARCWAAQGCGQSACPAEAVRIPWPVRPIGGNAALQRPGACVTPHERRRGMRPRGAIDRGTRSGVTRRYSALGPGLPVTPRYSAAPGAAPRLDRCTAPPRAGAIRTPRSANARASSVGCDAGPAPPHHGRGNAALQCRPVARYAASPWARRSPAPSVSGRATCPGTWPGTRWRTCLGRPRRSRQLGSIGCNAALQRPGPTRERRGTRRL